MTNCHFRCCIAESFSRALVAGAESQVFYLSHRAHSRVVVDRVDGKDDAAKKKKKKKQEKQNARDDSYTSRLDSIDKTTLKELVKLVRWNVHCSDTKPRRVFHERNTPSFT
jgi:hypothetical protein